MIRSLRHQLGVFVRYVASMGATANEEALFALGNQKAGTTVIAALLAEHAGLSVTLDFRDLSAPLLRELYAGTRSFEAFVQRYEWHFSSDLVKEPNLTFLYSALAGRFPQARFFMIVRDPRANIRSILNRLELPSDPKQAGPTPLESVPPIWRTIVESEGLDLGGDTYVEKLAHRWNRAVDVYLERTSTMPLIRYEDFLEDKEGAIARLASQLQLPAVNDISGQVDVQYQPAGHGVDWSDFFDADQLTSIERICEGRMQELGYMPRKIFGRK